MVGGAHPGKLEPGSVHVLFHIVCLDICADFCYLGTENCMLTLKKGMLIILLAKKNFTAAAGGCTYTQCIPSLPPGVCKEFCIDHLPLLPPLCILEQLYI